jgi:hypothetical protein
MDNFLFVYSLTAQAVIMQRLYLLTRMRQHTIISARVITPPHIGRVRASKPDVRLHSAHSRQAPQADNNSFFPPGGSGTWSKVDPSLVVDIALKTLIGLGVGKYILSRCIQRPTSSSFYRGKLICILVQTKCPFKGEDKR